jgi:hypothetical protein
MAPEPWRDVAARKQKSNQEKVAEWRLPSDVVSQISPETPINVLSIPATCGILNAHEIDLTENYSASELIQVIAAGKVK